MNASSTYPTVSGELKTRETLFGLPILLFVVVDADAFVQELTEELLADLFLDFDLFLFDAAIFL